jgi:hypothetical protein
MCYSKGLLAPSPDLAPNAAALPSQTAPCVLSPVVDVVSRFLPKILKPPLHATTRDIASRGRGEPDRAGADQDAEQQAGGEEPDTGRPTPRLELFDVVVGKLFVFHFIIGEFFVFFSFQFARHDISSTSR